MGKYILILILILRTAETFLSRIQPTPTAASLGP